MEQRLVSAYDAVAGMYDAMWANWYLPGAMPALEKLFFSKVPPETRVLDVCCGSGHVTQELVRRGYRVTGVDSSAELIALAQTGLPTATFSVQDARALRVNGCFDAAISTFDSLNHVMTIDELHQVFENVHRALERGGRFVFDMNLAEAYTADLRQWHVDMNERSVGLVRGTYDFETKKASTELIWFVREGSSSCWKRHESIVEQRCYSEGEILAAAYAAGFGSIESVKATSIGVNASLGFGRIFVTAIA